jgi:beta-barrel assembly-enhancing protease
MLNSLLFAAIIATAPAMPTDSGCTACATALEPRLEQIVAEAWASVQDDAPAISRVADKRHQADIDKDIEMGRKYTEIVEKEYKLSTDQDHIERVNRIGGHLAEVANRTPVRVSWGDSRLSPFPYEFKVLEGEDINAFSLPGGFIYVYDGLLTSTDGDDELAGVLAHEIAHASLRHIATFQREQSRLSTWTLPAVIAAIILGGETGHGVLMGSQLLTQANASGWHINAEKAADYAGLQYMIKSDYNPVAMLTMMERLARNERFRASTMRTLGIFQTHPLSRDRADALTAHLKDLGIPIKRSLASTVYRVDLRDLPNGAVEAWFDGRKLYTFGGSNARARSEEAAKKLNDFFDQVPELFEVQSREADVILGRRLPLLKIEPEDVAAVGASSMEELNRNTINSIKSVLYLLAYRIWDTR